METTASPTQETRTGRKALVRQLWFWVIVGFAAGAAVGFVFPHAATGLQPLGTLFVSMMKMLVAPIVFCAIVSGIQSVDDLRGVGRIGGKAIAWFLSVTALLMFVGLIAGHLFHPGSGLNIDAKTLSSSSLDSNQTHIESGWDFVASTIPTSLFSAFTSGQILSVLLVSVLIGLSIKSVGDKATGITRVIDGLTTITFKLVSWVLWLSPIGAFGAIAYTVGEFGGKALASLGMLVLTLLAAVLFTLFIVFAAIAAICGVNMIKLIRYLRNELLIGLATGAGEAVLPSQMQRLERLGVRKDVVRLVLPAGYSFNLDGTALYITIAILFMAQATNTPLSVGQQILACGVLLIVSKGSAGFSGGVIIVLASTMGSIVPIPLAALSLIVGVDRLLSSIRISVTVMGNAIATLVVARWENAIDWEILHAELDRSPKLDRDDTGATDESDALNGSAGSTTGALR